MKQRLIALAAATILTLGGVGVGTTFAAQQVSCTGANCTSTNPAGNNQQDCKNVPANQPPAKCK